MRISSGCEEFPLKIGSVTLQSNLALAPLAGVTDLAFRELCREFGAGYAVSEMVSAKALYYRDKKTDALLRTSRADRPVALQIFGSEPAVMAWAVEPVLRHEPDVIDINMGCPMPKIVKSGDGSALMRRPRLIGEIVAAVVKASPVPVTVKLRTGWDDGSKNAVECARYAEDAGAAAITVHGRTREKLYAPGVDYAAIAAVKAAVRVPVFGNGDVADGPSARRMFDETGCDGVMIGRASLGNPFVFREIAAYLAGRACPPPTLREKLSVASRHIRALVALKGEHIGILEARKHLAWYLKGVRGAAAYKARCDQMKTAEQFDELIYDILRAAGEEGERD